MTNIIDQARAWVDEEAGQIARLASLQMETDLAFVLAQTSLRPETLCILVTATPDYAALSVRTGTTDRALAAVALRRAAEFLEKGMGRV
jgi:hypothetical protein